MVGLILGHNGAEAEVLNLSDVKLLLRKESLPFHLTFRAIWVGGRIPGMTKRGMNYPTKVMLDGQAVADKEPGF